jgi:hypothetical protein
MLTAALAPVNDDPEATRAFQFMLRDSPALRGRWLEEQRRNRDRLAEALRPWFGEDANPLAPLAAGAALLTIDEVMTLWADHPSMPDLLSLLEQALCPWSVSSPRFWPPDVRTPRGDVQL